MKTRGITWYELVGFALLLAGAMLFPGRAITEPLDLKRRPIPEEELKEIKKPRTKIAPVRISGSVRKPDGTLFYEEVIIKVYGILEGLTVYIKEEKTNKKTAAFAVQLGGKWLGKEVKLVPKFRSFREGEHFNPQERRIPIRRATQSTAAFIYTGPLPDLIQYAEFDPYYLEECCPDKVESPRGSGGRPGGACIGWPAAAAAIALAEQGEYIRFHYRIVFGVKTNGHLESGPFKVRIEYSLPHGDSHITRTKVLDFPSLSAGVHHLEILDGEWVDSSSRYFKKFCEDWRLFNYHIDCDHEVVESDERNNYYP